jgi:DHA1 family tetracycline resistance protein-like MFS transporter
MGAVVQGGLVGRLAKRVGEIRLVVFGTFASFLALGAMPYVSGLGPLLAVLALLALGQGLASPSLSSLTSKLVDRDEVGGVMGVYQGMASLGRIVGPFWGELVYGSLGFAWPFRTGSLFMLLAVVVAGVMAARLGQARVAEQVA